jgi:hypothetical protein
MAKKPRKPKTPKETPPNRDGMTEDQKLALHLQHEDKLSALAEEMCAANSQWRNARKAAKADLGEEGLKDIDAALKLAAPGGEVKMKLEYERILRVAKWHGAPIGQQLGLLDTVPAKDWRYEGKKLGLLGKPAKAPDGISSADLQTFMEGYHEGQAVLAEGFGKPKVAETAPAAQGAAAAAQPDNVVTLGTVPATSKIKH